MASETTALTQREKFEAAMRERVQRELLSALPILQDARKIAHVLDVTSSNIAGAAKIGYRLKKGTRQPRPYQFVLVPRRELPEDEEDDAPGIIEKSKEALDAIAFILRRSIESIFSVIESSDGETGRYAAGLMTDELVGAIEQLHRLAAPYRRVTRDVARRRIDFPSLISLSRKVANDREDLVRRQLGLGTKLPFRIDPRTTYTPCTRLAMEIVTFIDSDRHRKGSIYRILVPDLHEKEFSNKHATTWDRVIGFHLDFFQSPTARRAKFAKQQDSSRLQDAMEARLSSENQRHFRRSSRLGPFGEITAMLEFRYRRGKKVKMKTPGEFYNRVKHKVIEAALALMPK